jgi:hypothetical protein
MPTLESFNAYASALGSHDWHFGYSDDHSVWRAGTKAHADLLRQAADEPILQRAYVLWTAHVYRRGTKPELLSRLNLGNDIQKLRDEVIAANYAQAA